MAESKSLKDKLADKEHLHIVFVVLFILLIGVWLFIYYDYTQQTANQVEADNITTNDSSVGTNQIQPQAFDWSKQVVLDSSAAATAKNDPGWKLYSVSDDGTSNGQVTQIWLPMTKTDIGSRSINIGDSGDDVKVIQAMLEYINGTATGSEPDGVMTTFISDSLSQAIDNPDVYGGGSVSPQAVYALVNIVNSWGS